jgi:hypothetical protein
MSAYYWHFLYRESVSTPSYDTQPFTVAEIYLARIQLLTSFRRMCYNDILKLVQILWKEILY